MEKFSASEITRHSSKKDCWLVIHGKVYDVSTFLEDHPGGEDVLLHASSTGDATQSFEEVGHSSTAKSMMEGYVIGLLEGAAETSGDALKASAPKATEGTSAKPRTMQQKKPPSSSIMDYILPLLILGVAVGAWYYLTYLNKE